jgi:uncharacterized membrane protein YvbJ
MTSETPSKPTKLCPTCGTRVSEDAARCLVCGSDLTGGEKPSSKNKAIHGSRMPELTLSLSTLLLLAVHRHQCNGCLLARQTTLS